MIKGGYVEITWSSFFCYCFLKIKKNFSCRQPTQDQERRRGRGCRCRMGVGVCPDIAFFLIPFGRVDYF